MKTSLFSKTFKTLLMVVFILGLLTVGLAYTIRYARKPSAPVGFKMTSTQTYTPTGGKARVTATVERFQKADGTFKSVYTYYNPDGSVQRTNSSFGQAGRGVFRVDEKSKTSTFLSPMPAKKPIFTEDILRSDPNFVREEIVLGYKTFVSRLPDDDSSDYTELYRAIDFQGLAIKMVDVSSGGTNVLEPTKIEIGEPDAKIFEAPDYPINYEEYKQKTQPK